MESEDKKQEDLIEYFLSRANCGKKDIRSYSPLTLAYIGDAVYDLLIRTEKVSHGNCPVKQYHKRVSGIVNAKAQAELMHMILPELTDEERDVYKRGRNANSKTKAKNATTGNYHRATGLEALIGYLYLTKQYERITDLILIGRRKMEEQGEADRRKEHR